MRGKCALDKIKQVASAKCLANKSFILMVSSRYQLVVVQSVQVAEKKGVIRDLSTSQINHRFDLPEKTHARPSKVQLCVCHGGTGLPPQGTTTGSIRCGCREVRRCWWRACDSSTNAMQLRRGREPLKSNP